MRVDEIMSRAVFSVPYSSVVADACDVLLSRGALNLLVIDSGRVVGTVSVREVSGQAPDTPVSSIMNRDFKTAPPSTTLKDAARLMIGRKAGCLPILEGGRVIGIVTSSDLMRVLVRESATPPSPAHDAV